MALAVQYTETFELTFKTLVEFIRENWGEKTEGEFIKEADKIIQLIREFPLMYKSSAFDSGIRIAQINKLSSLFYEVTVKYITLLYIVDSRQEPFWL